MEAPATTTLEVRADGERGTIMLNRPDKLNPLGTVTLRELVAVARWFDEQPQVKVVVIGGHGRAFSAGADLAAFTAVDSDTAALRAAADAGRQMAEAIEAMTAVTVARIHGHCVGGALVLAAACDLRVAAEDARFSIPEVDLGIPLAWGGIPRLVREIGPALAKELVLTCRPFDAAEAKTAGFLNRVVPAGDLDAAVEELTAALVTKSAMTLSATKRHTNAVTAGMVDPGRAWNDADSLLAAMNDTESRRAAAQYLASRDLANRAAGTTR